MVCYTPVFPSSHKLTFLNCYLIKIDFFFNWKMKTHFVDVLPLNYYLFIIYLLFDKMIRVWQRGWPLWEDFKDFKANPPAFLEMTQHKFYISWSDPQYLLKWPSRWCFLIWKWPPKTNQGFENDPSPKWPLNSSPPPPHTSSSQELND